MHHNLFHVECNSSRLNFLIGGLLQRDGFSDFAVFYPDAWRGGRGNRLGFRRWRRCAAIFKVVSGRWADKTKKYRTFVFAGYLFSAVAKFLYPLSSTWRQILAIRPIERIGKGIRDAPRDAILSESLSHEHRGRGFGIHRAMDSAGAILGSLAVLIFVFYLNLGFQKIFFISAVVALFAAVPIIFVKVPEHLKIAGKSLVSGAFHASLKNLFS